MIEHLTKSRSWSFISQRIKTPFAEVDLLFETPYGWAMVEVKSLCHHSWSAVRLSQKQAQRLRQAHLWLSEKNVTSIHLALVLTDYSKQNDSSTEVLVFDENFGV